MRSALESALLEIINDGGCEGFGDVEFYGKYVSLVEDFQDEDWVVIEDRYGCVYLNPYEHIAISVDEGYYQPARKRFNAERDEYDLWLATDTESWF